MSDEISQEARDTIKAATSAVDLPQMPGQLRSLSVMLDRLDFMRQAGITFGGARDLFQVLGYERVITTQQYLERYARGGIAGRIVDVMPDATWRGVPSFEVLEDKDDKKDTDFELQWKNLEQRLQVSSRFHRVDKLARLSTYAVLLIGVKNKVALDQELPRGTGKTDDIIFLSAFLGGGGPGATSRNRTVADTSDATIAEYDTSTSSPRFGLPLFYQLRRIDAARPLFDTRVHWSRVVHVAEGLLDNDVFGLPALERVWNLLDDLEKVTGGGAEAFWLRANQGLHLDVDKDMALPNVKDTIESLKEQAEEYKHQITRWLRTRGVTVETLGSDVANFGPPAEAVITQIAGAKAIPKRILTGSEMGELASSQDRENFKDQVNGRQTQYAAPQIIRQFVDRLIAYNYLPEPRKGPAVYDVRWPHMQVLTEDEKAAGAQKWADVNRTAGVTVFTDKEIRDHWYGMTEIGDNVDERVHEQWRADLAGKMADANSKAGFVVFTSDEIRKTCYDWDPLTDEEKTADAPPAPAATSTPVPSVVPNPSNKLQAASDRELVRLLADAIDAGATDVVARILQIGREYTLSSVQINLPPQLGLPLLQFGRKISDADLYLPEGGRENKPHVTVKYGLAADVDPEVVRAACKGFGPLTLTLGQTFAFTNDAYDVLYADVKSDKLDKLNQIISNLPGITNTTPTYVPHATIAYLLPGKANPFIGQDVLEGLASSIISGREVVTVKSVWLLRADGEQFEVSLV